MPTARIFFDGKRSRFVVSTSKKPVSKAAANSTKGKPRAGATTASILGEYSQKPGKATTAVSNRNIKIKPEWAEYYQNLLELRERLLHQMTGLAKESAEEMSSYSLHMASCLAFYLLSLLPSGPKTDWPRTRRVLKYSTLACSTVQVATGGW